MRRLSTIPIFWLLTPLFFVLKNLDLYPGAVPTGQSMLLFAGYSLSAILLFILLRLVTKLDNRKAALISFILLGLYFFYGSLDRWIQDQHWLRPLNRYRYSLPLILGVVASLIVWVVRSRKIPGRTIVYLNVLLLLFCGWEAISLLGLSLGGRRPALAMEEDSAMARLSSFPQQKPDIYFIVMDEYQGNRGLQSYFHFDNRKFREELGARGFFEPSLARSSYNYTFFSLPSIFGMNYISGEVQGSSETENILHFSEGMNLMHHAAFPRILEANGYSIYNLSPFRITEQGNRISAYRAIVAEKDLLTSQTFFQLWKEKAGWMIPNKALLRWINPGDYDLQFYNQEIKDSVFRLTAGNTPRFVYAHFFMPHPPFLKDSLGKDVNFKEYIEKRYLLDSNYMKQHYLDYLKYANGFALDVIDHILKKDDSALIILMSDHGFRGIRPLHSPYLFDIQLYIRSPRANIQRWPDTLDAVNVFRFLLADQFQQSVKLLPYRSHEFHETF